MAVDLVAATAPYLRQRVPVYRHVPSFVVGIDA
jgi:hypothetical protein